MEHLAKGTLAELNDWIHGQREVLLRLGLSRAHHAPSGGHGYWMQANGLYTFPTRHPAIRGWPPETGPDP